MAFRFIKISPKEAKGIRKFVEGVIEGKQGKQEGNRPGRQGV